MSNISSISNISNPCNKCIHFRKNQCMIFYKFTMYPDESTNSNIVSFVVEPELAIKMRKDETKCGQNGAYFAKDV